LISIPNKVMIHTGNCLSVLKSLPAESIHCVVTSPPYFGLRNYGNPDQIGLESSPQEYVAHLVEVFRQIKRVLRPDGTVWLNIGDSYATQPGKGSNVPQTKWQANSYPDSAPHRSISMPGLKPKDLIGIPWRLALALQEDGWWLRSEIIWEKFNGLPESVTDRVTRSHEHVFMLTKSSKYFYDATAILEEPQSGPSDVKKMLEKKERIGGKHKTLVDSLSKASATTNVGTHRGVGDPFFRNKRSVWTIGLQPFHGGHFAVMPSKLAEPCILAGTSEKGCCPTCGAPWVRLVKKWEAPSEKEYHPVNTEMDWLSQDDDLTGPVLHTEQTIADRTLGWEPTCKCSDNTSPTPCTVLDPFFGVGTTALVSMLHGRSCVGIELNPEYVKMAVKRLEDEFGVIGMNAVEVAG